MQRNNLVAIMLVAIIWGRNITIRRRVALTKFVVKDRP